MDKKKNINSLNIDQELNQKGISITFEDLDSNKINEFSANELSNKNIWKEKFFERILYEELKNNYIQDQLELQQKYISWHKNLLNSIINPKTYTFENTTFSNALKIMNIHPYLTKKDKKNLDLIKSQIKNSYQKHYVFNCIFGFTMILMIIKRKFPNVEFKELVKRQKYRIIGYNMLIFIAYDSFFNSVVKLRLLNNYSEEYKLKQKYISDYL